MKPVLLVRQPQGHEDVRLVADDREICPSPVRFPPRRRFTFIRDTGDPSSTRNTFSQSLAQRRISIHLMSK